MVHVNKYKRKDGTKVTDHNRRKPHYKELKTYDRIPDIKSQKKEGSFTSMVAKEKNVDELSKEATKGLDKYMKLSSGEMKEYQDLYSERTGRRATNIYEKENFYEFVNKTNMKDALIGDMNQLDIKNNRLLSDTYRNSLSDELKRSIQVNKEMIQRDLNNVRNMNRFAYKNYRSNYERDLKDYQREMKNLVSSWVKEYFGTKSDGSKTYSFRKREGNTDRYLTAFSDDGGETYVIRIVDQTFKDGNFGSDKYKEKVSFREAGLSLDETKKRLGEIVRENV